MCSLGFLNFFYSASGEVFFFSLGGWVPIDAIGSLIFALSFMAVEKWKKKCISETDSFIYLAKKELEVLSCPFAQH